MLKNRNFAVGVVMILLVGALLYATTAILPLFMQNLLNYTALAAGLAMTPRGIGALAATIVVGRIVGRVSNRFLIGASALLMAYSCFMLGNINLQIAPDNLLWPIIISGVAAASIFVPLTTSALGTLSQEQMGNATGIFNLMRNVGGSIGIAMITTLVTRHAQTSQAASRGICRSSISTFNNNSRTSKRTREQHRQLGGDEEIARSSLQHPPTTKFAPQLCLRFSFLRAGLPWYVRRSLSASRKSANRPVPSRCTKDKLSHEPNHK